MVEHAAQRILRVRVRDRVLDGFADGDAEAARALRVFGQQLAPELGLIARAGMDRRPPGMHQHPAVGLVLVAHLDHVNVAFQPEQLAGQGQGRAPLAGAGLGGQALGAGDLVEVGLGDRGVRLVAAGRAGALVLVIDVRRCLEGLLEADRPQQRRRAPEGVNVAHRRRGFRPDARRSSPVERGSRGRWPTVPRVESGCLVPGCSGGGRGSGKSGSRLYQLFGISAWVRSKRVCMAN